MRTVRGMFRNWSHTLLTGIELETTLYGTNLTEEQR